MLHFDLGSVSLQNDTDFYQYLAIGLLGGTTLVGILCLILSKPITSLLKIPTKIYAPIILVLICWSCYQISYTYYDIILLGVCSIIGILTKNLSKPAILLAFILFSKIEVLTYQASSMYNILDLIYRPIFLVLVIITLLIIISGMKFLRSEI